MKRSPRWLCAISVVCALSVVCAACGAKTSEPLTEVLVQIYADTLVQQSADQLTVEVVSGPASATELSPGEPEVFDLTQKSFHWPATLALVARPAHADHVFELTIRVERRGSVVARGRAKSAFVKGQTLLLQTTLSAQCLGKLDCAADETCVVSNGRATCQSAAVDAGSLPRVTETPKQSDAGKTDTDASVPGDAGPMMMGRDAGSDAGHPSMDAAVMQDAGNTTCVPHPEVCDNALDDDCDNAPDCADSDCEPITQCIPAAQATVLVAADQACPVGFEPNVPLHQDLKDGGCDGCACKQEPTVCEPVAYVYTDALSCADDQPPYKLSLMLPDAVTTDCSRPIGKQYEKLSTEGASGVRAQVIPGKDICIAGGTSSTVAPAWSTTMKQCTRPLRHAGCGINGFCAPKRRDLCWPSPLNGCSSTATAQLWWQSYEDTRVCQPCACEAGSGSCADVHLLFDTTSSCLAKSSQELKDGDKLCGIFPPDTTVRSIGLPKDADCKSYATAQGRLIPTQPLNLCCSQ